jgi:hypothetical protein
MKYVVTRPFAWYIFSLAIPKVEKCHKKHEKADNIDTPGTPGNLR